MIPDEVAATAVPRSSYLSGLERAPKTPCLQAQFARDSFPAVPVSQAQMTSFQESTEFLLAGEL